MAHSHGAAGLALMRSGPCKHLESDKAQPNVSDHACDVLMHLLDLEMQINLKRLHWSGPLKLSSGSAGD